MNSQRYDRHIILKEFGAEAQQRLSDASVLVVGAGGLGIPVLTYLNAMGVGTLGMVDNDQVSLSNLHRQVLYNEDDVGRKKVTAAVRKLTAQNRETNLRAHDTFLTRDNALDIIAEYDVVVDASDNFPTRYLVNDSCVILKKPFVYGALHGFEGQVSVFNYKNGPTYRCLFPDMPGADEVPNCNEHGVLGIVPGIVGNLQALETVKVLTGVGQPLSGKLLLFNGLANSFQKIKFSVNPQNTKIKGLRANYDFSCDLAVQSISAPDFEELLKKESLQIIDVRTAIEYKESHINGVRHLPLSELESGRVEFDVKGKAYVLCQSGVRSQKAIVLLQKFFPTTTFFNVAGGMNQLHSYAAKY